MMPDGTTTFCSNSVNDMNVSFLAISVLMKHVIISNPTNVAIIAFGFLYMIITRHAPISVAIK